MVMKGRTHFCRRNMSSPHIIAHMAEWLKLDMFKSGNWNETGMIKVNFFLVFTLSGVVVSGKGDDWPTETWLRSQVSTARRSTPHLLPPSSLPLCLSISTEVGEFGGEGCQPPPPRMRVIIWKQTIWNPELTPGVPQAWVRGSTWGREEESSRKKDRVREIRREKMASNLLGRIFCDSGFHDCDLTVILIQL